MSERADTETAELFAANQRLEVEVAARRMEERARRESEALFRRVFDSAPMGLGLVDPDGRFVKVNDALCALLGASGAQLCSAVFFDRTHGDDRRADEDGLSRLLAGELDVVEREKRVLGANDATCWVSSSVAAVRAEDGHALFLLLMVVDISARKKAQDELEQSAERLRLRNEEIRGFYHTLSHELKTPLTSIGEFVALVREGLAGPVNEQQIDFLETAQRNCERMRLLIEDIVDVARIETGKMSIARARVSVKSLVDATIESHMGTAVARGIELEAEIRGEVSDVWADEHRIQQVLSNLVNNALKFTERGGHVRVWATACGTESRFASFTVQDTGRGIDARHLPKLFNRLQQVCAEDATELGGLGFGLSICRDLVLLHGGEIVVASELGHGSTFTFTVPCDSANSAASGCPTESSS